MAEILTQTGIQNVTALLGCIMTFIGACAFLASIITETLKSIPQTGRMPTKLLCYLVSLVITTPVYLGVMAYLHQPVEWFMVFASFLASFVVAKVSMSGWDDVTELAGRMFRK